MPDPTRKTISASQAPALYNASPYITQWMLFHYLRGAEVHNDAVTDRMRWGLKMQPLVLEQAAQDLKLEIQPNKSNHYLHSNRGPLGYTADAFIHDPDRGNGAVEVKCVFDYAVLYREWNGGQSPPRHVELQLQHQLAVGDGKGYFEWGVIALWVCGEMKYFERKRDDTVTSDLIARCSQMMREVMTGKEPDPFGNAAELPILAELFPVVKGKELDLRDAPETGPFYAQIAADLKQHKADANFHDKAAAAAREQLLFLARDNETVLLPGATLKLRTVNVKEHMRKASSYVNLSIELTDEETKPQELPDGAPV